MAKRIYMRSDRARGYSNQLLQQLQNEGNRLIQQMRDQFARELLQQVRKSETETAGSSGADGASLSSFNALFSGALKFLSLGRSKTSAQETIRSSSTRQQFRLSQSQAAAEANAALVRGQKNG